MKNISYEPLTNQQLYDAVRDGVDNAFWRMITNATSMPCHDFYDTIKRAAQEAFEKVALFKDEG